MTHPLRSLGRKLSPVILVAVLGCGGGATATQSIAADRASPDRVRAHVDYLASDEMQGRASGTVEFDRAAGYVEEQLLGVGLDPLFGDSFRQPFVVQKMRFTGDGGLHWSSEGVEERFEELEDLAFMGVDTRGDSGDSHFGLVFVGLGIHHPEAGWDDYAGIDLTGRCAVLTLDTPASLISSLPQHLITQYTDLSVGPSTKAWTALRRGAACVLAFPSEYAPPGMLAPMLSSAILQQQFVVNDQLQGAIGPAAVISGPTAARLLGTARPDLSPGGGGLLEGQVFFDVSWTGASALETANVGAIIPGSDPELAHEVIVLSAHLDGQGMSGQEVMNSANDNASSVAALLEASRLLANTQPRRTVHLLFTAMEEQGLLGAQHFVENPPGGRANFRLNINMEMIGKPRRSLGKHDFRVSSRVEPALEALVRAIEQGNSDVDFDYSHRSDQDGRPIFRNADHVNFFLRGIPTLYFWGGSEDYHQPSDDPEGINVGKVATMADLLVAAIEATDRLDQLPGW